MERSSMENLQKDFVPYELSLKMKQLGFDEPCMYYVDEQNNSFIYNFQTHPDEFIEWCGVTVISTPLYQQCFRWFREKYGLFVDPNAISYEDGPYLWFFEINSIVLPFGTDLGETSDFKTYEEAELECLKKLIEIVKTHE
jgi:hypothetical protein